MFRYEAIVRAAKWYSGLWESWCGQAFLVLVLAFLCWMTRRLSVLKSRLSFFLFFFFFWYRKMRLVLQCLKSSFHFWKTLDLLSLPNFFASPLLLPASFCFWKQKSILAWLIAGTLFSDASLHFRFHERTFGRLSVGGNVLAWIHVIWAQPSWR